MLSANSENGESTLTRNDGSPSAGNETIRRTNVDEVINSLPLVGSHYILLGAASLGYLCDAFDTYIVGFAMPVISTEWHLSPLFNGALASAGMWGMFLGAALWGPVGDRIGRKASFAATVIGFSIVSGATALSRNPAEFVALRWMSGLFLGGMLPVVSVLVAEQVGASRRGSSVAIPSIFWPVGLFVAASAAFVVMPRFGWRALFCLGLVPFCLGVFVINKVDESARWLFTRGDTSRAKNVLQSLGASEVQLGAVGNASGQKPTSTSLLLQPPYFKRLGLCSGILFFGFFGYYGFILWIPSILAMHFNLRMSNVLGLTIWIGAFAVLGKLAAYLTIDRLGRTPLFYFGFGLAGFASLAFGLASGTTYLIACACILSFLLEAAAAACVVLPTELFPSQVRGTASAWTSSAGKFAATLSPVVFGFFISRQQYYAIFVFMALFFWAACALVAALGIDPAGKALGEMDAS
jgi:MFS transporter, putative metabolite:H+ symporter